MWWLLEPTSPTSPHACRLKLALCTSWAVCAPLHTFTYLSHSGRLAHAHMSALTCTAPQLTPTESDVKQVHGQSSFVARSGWAGIHAMPASRAPRDVRGRLLDVRFRILDARPGNGSSKYEVAVRLEVGFFV